MPDLVQLTIICWRTRVCGNILTTKIRGKILPLLKFIGDFPPFFGWTRFQPTALLAFNIIVRSECAVTKFSADFKTKMGKKCMLVSIKEICQPDTYFRTNKIISLRSPHLIWLKHFLGKKSIFPKNFAAQTWRAPQCSPVWWWWSQHSPRQEVSSTCSTAGWISCAVTEKELTGFVEKFNSPWSGGGI